ncbi:MAG: glycosyltransferase family 39 protein, partial [bacterium]
MSDDRSDGEFRAGGGSPVWRWLAIGCLCLLAVAASNWPERHQPFYWDAAGYVLPHAREIHDNNLLPIVRQWDVGHPTAFYFLLAGLFKLFGVGPLAGHLLNWVFAALGLTAVYGLGRVLRLPHLLAGATVLVVWTFPLYFASSRQVMGDLALAACCLAALWAWATKRRWWYVLFASLAVLTKFHGFVLIPVTCLATVLSGVFSGVFSGVLATPTQRSGRPWREIGRELTWVAAPLLPACLFLLVRYLVRGPGWTIGWEPRQQFIPIWRWHDFTGNWSRATENFWEVSRLETVLWVTPLLLAVAVTVRWFRLRRCGDPPLFTIRQCRMLVGLLVFLLVYNVAMLQLSALMARFALPLVGVLFPLLVWAAWSLLPRWAPILLLLLLLVVGQIGFWYPDNLRVLPEPLTAL